MSAQRRRTVAVVGSLALAGGAIAIALAAGGKHGPEPNGSTAQSGSRAERSTHGGDVLAALRDHAERDAAAEEARAARQVVGDPRAEDDAREQEMATFAAERRAAEPIARRFLSAFAAYELGELSSAIKRRLAETTTVAFGRELLAGRAPRVPVGASAPPPARLVALDFVPGESRGRRLLSLELVATLERDGHRTPLAIALRRADRGWLVEALGR